MVGGGRGGGGFRYGTKNRRVSRRRNKPFELSIRRDRLPKSKGSILHSFMMGTDKSLDAATNVQVITYMEQEVLRLGKARGFQGIFTTNTNPLTQVRKRPRVPYISATVYYIAAGAFVVARATFGGRATKNCSAKSSRFRHPPERSWSPHTRTKTVESRPSLMDDRSRVKRPPPNGRSGFLANNFPAAAVG